MILGFGAIMNNWQRLSLDLNLLRGKVD